MVIHAIWECSAAQDVRARSTTQIEKCDGENDDFMQLFQFMIAKLSVEELKTFIVQSWLIWHRRNSLLYGNSMQRPGQLNKKAMDFLKEYREAQTSLWFSLSWFSAKLEASNGSAV